MGVDSELMKLRCLRIIQGRISESESSITSRGIKEMGVIGIPR